MNCETAFLTHPDPRIGAFLMHASLSLADWLPVAAQLIGCRSHLNFGTRIDMLDTPTTMLFLSFYVFLFLHIASASWISVQLPSGSWVAVQEIVAKRRYLLHPQALVVNVVSPKGCSHYSPTTIEVRFWDPSRHKIVEAALNDQGTCLSEDSCRLEPYQARFVRIRDLFQVWKPVRYRRSIPITLPPTMRFDLIRDENGTCFLLSPRDLAGLVFEFQGIGSRNQTEDIVIEGTVSGLINGVKPEPNITITSEKEIQLKKEIDKLKAQLAMQTIDRSLAVNCPNQSEEAVTSQTERNLLNISDCLDVKLCNLKEGLYFIPSLDREVFCTTLGEMLVYKRTRIDRTFNERWNQYERGIGTIRAKNYFIGLRAMRSYTASGDKCMRIFLVPKNESLSPRNGQYSNFVIGPSSEGYKLFYNKFSGTLTKDPFRYHKKRYFTTVDRKRSLSLRCAKTYKGGGWYIACFHIDLFGYPARFAPKAFSSKGLSKEKPKEHYELRFAYMTLRSVSGDPQALKTVFSDYSTVCPTRVQEWIVPEPGEYLITIGGAPGGTSSHVNSSPGGRGALVRMRMFLKKDIRLRIVVGCAGNDGYFSGSGGDGSFVADKGRWRLLAAAGGGGGAGW